MSGAPCTSTGRPSHDTNVVVPLPVPPRGGLVLLLTLGALLLAVALVLDLGGARFIAAGLGLAIAGFVIAILLNRETPSVIVIASTEAHVTVAGRDGSRAIIDIDVIDAVEVSPDGGNRASHAVWLRKRDGGRIQLARFRDPADADELASRLRAPLTLARDSLPPGFDEAPPSPEQRLAGARLVATVRGGADDEEAAPGHRERPDGPTLRLSWPSARPLKATIPALVGAVGIVLTAYGMYRQHAGLALALVVSGAALLFIVALLSGLRQLGVTECVCVGHQGLRIQRRRGARLLREQTVRLSALVAVDYSHAFDTPGGFLWVRTATADTAAPPPHDQDELAGEHGTGPSDSGEAVAPGKTAGTTSRLGIQVPLGALPLADRINVDLAISDEVARRRTAEPGRP